MSEITFEQYQKLNHFLSETMGRVDISDDQTDISILQDSIAELKSRRETLREEADMYQNPNNTNVWAIERGIQSVDDTIDTATMVLDIMEDFPYENQTFANAFKRIDEMVTEQVTEQIADYVSEHFSSWTEPISRDSSGSTDFLKLLDFAKNNNLPIASDMKIIFNEYRGESRSNIDESIEIILIGDDANYQLEVFNFSPHETYVKDLLLHHIDTTWCTEWDEFMNKTETSYDGFIPDSRTIGVEVRPILTEIAYSTEHTLESYAQAFDDINRLEESIKKRNSSDDLDYLYEIKNGIAGRFIDDLQSGDIEAYVEIRYEESGNYGSNYYDKIHISFEDTDVTLLPPVLEKEIGSERLHDFLTEFVDETVKYEYEYNFDKDTEEWDEDKWINEEDIREGYKPSYRQDENFSNLDEFPLIINAPTEAHEKLIEALREYEHGENAPYEYDKLDSEKTYEQAQRVVLWGECVNRLSEERVNEILSFIEDKETTPDWYRTPADEHKDNVENIIAQAYCDKYEFTQDMVNYIAGSQDARPLEEIIKVPDMVNPVQPVDVVSNGKQYTTSFFNFNYKQDIGEKFGTAFKKLNGLEGFIRAADSADMNISSQDSSHHTAISELYAVKENLGEAFIKQFNEINKHDIQQEISKNFDSESLEERHNRNKELGVTITYDESHYYDSPNKVIVEFEEREEQVRGTFVPKPAQKELAEFLISNTDYTLQPSASSPYYHKEEGLRLENDSQISKALGSNEYANIYKDEYNKQYVQMRQKIKDGEVQVDTSTFKKDSPSFNLEDISPEAKEEIYKTIKVVEEKINEAQNNPQKREEFNKKGDQKIEASAPMGKIFARFSESMKNEAPSKEMDFDEYLDSKAPVESIEAPEIDTPEQEQNYGEEIA